MLSLKFDVPNAVCFGNVMSVQSCCGMSAGVLGMAPFGQKQTPKLLSKNEGQLFVTRESTKVKVVKVPPLQLVEAFEVETGEESILEKKKKSDRKPQIKQPKQKGTLKNRVSISFLSVFLS